MPLLAMRYGKTETTKAFGLTAKLLVNSGVDRELPTILGGKEKIYATPSIDNYFIADVEGNLTLRDDMNIDDKDVYYVNAKDIKFTQKQFLEMMQPFVQEVSNRGLLKCLQTAKLL